MQSAAGEACALTGVDLRAHLSSDRRLRLLWSAVVVEGLSAFSVAVASARAGGRVEAGGFPGSKGGLASSRNSSRRSKFRTAAWCADNSTASFLPLQTLRLLVCLPDWAWQLVAPLVLARVCCPDGAACPVKSSPAAACTNGPAGARANVSARLLLGDVVAVARRHGVPAPACEALFVLLRNGAGGKSKGKPIDGDGSAFAAGLCARAARGDVEALYTVCGSPGTPWRALAELVARQAAMFFVVWMLTMYILM